MAMHAQGGRHDEALSLLKEAAEACAAAFGEGHPHTKTITGNLARVLQEEAAGDA